MVMCEYENFVSTYQGFDIWLYMTTFCAVRCFYATRLTQPYICTRI